MENMIDDRRDCINIKNFIFYIDILLHVVKHILCIPCIVCGCYLCFIYSKKSALVYFFSVVKWKYKHIILLYL